MFSGDIDLSGRTDSMPWFQWSLTVWSCFGKFNQTATRWLQLVETSVEDPIITDDTAMTNAERRLSAQAYCVLALTFREKVLQVVQRVPRGFGSSMETAVQRIRPTSSGEIQRNAPSPLVADENRRSGADGPSAG